jgi:hypothetical protein
LVAIVKENPPGDIYTGPMASLRINDKGKQFMMLFEPSKAGEQILADRMVIAHERAHNAFHATYPGMAFINQSDSVQEALADFIPVHQFGSQKLWNIKNGKVTDLRNVEQRTHQLTKSPGTYDKIDTILSESTKNDSHRYALYYSHTLWRVRNAVGRDGMGKLLKPLVDDLNFHYVNAPIDKTKKGWEAERQSVRFVLASVLKTARERGYGEAVTPVIRQVAFELKVGVGNVEEISRRLTRSKLPRPDTPIRSSIVIYAPQVGAAGDRPTDFSEKP